MKSVGMFVAAILLLTAPLSTQSLDPGDVRLLRRSLNEAPYRTRVYLIGQSLGGYGALDLLARSRHAPDLVLSR